MADTDVKTYLGQLRALFDVDAFLKQEVSPRSIRRYYTECAWIYGLLHSPAGAVHLALNYDGRYNPDGFYEQPRLLQNRLTNCTQNGRWKLPAAKALIRTGWPPATRTPSFALLT